MNLSQVQIFTIDFILFPLDGNYLDDLDVINFRYAFFN